MIALVVALALLGLAADGNWPKVVRVALASLTYLGMVVGASEGPLRARAQTSGMPCAGFLGAGIVAGTVSGLLRPTVEPAVVATGALAAGALLGGVHWLALRHWRGLRAWAAPTNASPRAR